LAAFNKNIAFKFSVLELGMMGIANVYKLYPFYYHHCAVELFPLFVWLLIVDYKKGILYI